jgi:hypothetical protein
MRNGQPTASPQNNGALPQHHHRHPHSRPKMDIEMFNKNKLDIKVTATYSKRFHIHTVQIFTAYIHINNKYVQRPKKQQ